MRYVGKRTNLNEYDVSAPGAQTSALYAVYQASYSITALLENTRSSSMPAGKLIESFVVTIHEYFGIPIGTIVNKTKDTIKDAAHAKSTTILNNGGHPS